MPIIVKNTALAPAPLIVGEKGTLESDNGQTKATFNGGRVTYEAGGYTITITPKDTRYFDPESGLEDVLYDAGQLVPVANRDFHVRSGEAYPEMESYWTLEAGRLKHYMSVRVDLRAPVEILESPWLAAKDILEFSADLRVLADGSEASGDFQAEVLELVDGNGQVVFTLPPVEAWDQNDKVQRMRGRYICSTLTNGRLEVCTSVPYTWLSDPERRYPVIIDPTVVAASGTDALYGGNKIVELSNNWLISAVWNATNARYDFYKSVDSGTTWTTFGSAAYTGIQSGGNLAAFGTRVSLFAAHATGCVLLEFDAATVSSVTSNWRSVVGGLPSGKVEKIVHHAYTSTGNLWLAYAYPDGSNASYVNQIHVFAIKGTADGNGGYLFGTNYRLSSNDNGGYKKDPFVVIRTDDTPTVFFASEYYASNSDYRINQSVWQAASSSFVSVNFVSADYYGRAQRPRVGYNGARYVISWEEATGSTETTQKKISVRTTYSTGTGLYNGLNFSTTIQTLAAPVSNLDCYNAGITADPYAGKFYALYTTYDAASSKYQLVLKTSADGIAWDAAATVLQSDSTNDIKNATVKRTTSRIIAYAWQLGTTGSINSATISINVAPQKPTNLTLPNFDATMAANFSALFTDTPGDYPSAMEVEFYDVSSPSTPVWTIPKTGVPNSLTVTGNVPANKLQNGKTYQWRIRFYDSLGLVSPWSSYSTFKCSTAPSVSLVAIPGGKITTDSYTFQGVYTQAQGAPEQTFRFRLLNASGTSVVQDSGDLVGTANTKTFSGLANGTTYQIEFSATSQDGITATVKSTFSVLYTPPATPIVTATACTITASVKVAWTNPAPTGSQPTVTRNDVYRRKVGETTWRLVATGATTPYIDYTCPAGQHEYGVTGVTIGGAVSDYGRATVNSSFFGQWLIDEANPANSVCFKYNQNGAKIDPGQQPALQETFSQYPRERRGAANYKVGTLAALMETASAEQTVALAERLDAMAASTNTYLLKFASGFIYRVRIKPPKHDVTLGGVRYDVTVDWWEAANV
ncbi:hypothetical protein [Tumebacillus flagellatus]|uniref:Uncharacterized protein n=1 Tax=Tumebacillus flagellatus TaxID=1157490 RepID=A0A074LGY0_9BACL|nr:hypothetical protein [Tumebacillus flagellatus]KEO81486.1 hypothetical protein EL26_20655 [Tumebacillus flagellatus]